MASWHFFRIAHSLVKKLLTEGVFLIYDTANLSGWYCENLYDTTGELKHLEFTVLFEYLPNRDFEEFKEAVDTYYAMMGWDELGRPTAAKLYALGVGWVADA